MNAAKKRIINFEKSINIQLADKKGKLREGKLKIGVITDNEKKPRGIVTVMRFKKKGGRDESD